MLEGSYPLIYMILNERQHGVTQTQLKKFQVAVAEMATEAESARDRNQQLRYQAHLDAMNSEIGILQKDLQEYQKLKACKITKLN
jgi:phage host-nuclease inhibitor protein Gam